MIYGYPSKKEWYGVFKTDAAKRQILVCGYEGNEGVSNALFPYHGRFVQYKLFLWDSFIPAWTGYERVDVHSICCRDGYRTLRLGQTILFEQLKAFSGKEVHLVASLDELDGGVTVRGEWKNRLRLMGQDIEKDTLDGFYLEDGTTISLEENIAFLCGKEVKITQIDGPDIHWTSGLLRIEPGIQPRYALNGIGGLRGILNSLSRGTKDQVSVFTMSRWNAR